MIRLIALACLLVLLPLPLSALTTSPKRAVADEGAGMSAGTHFVMEAGARLPAATSSAATIRSALPGTIATPPPPNAGSRWTGNAPRVSSRQTAMLSLLGRLQLEGG